MSLLRMVLWVLVLALLLPAVAHAATGAAPAAQASAIARDWSPCLLALAALAFRARRFSRRAR
jgi:hypothetical protein